MTRLDVQDHVQEFFQNTTYYQDQDLNAAIQDGLDEICAITGCLWGSTTLPFQQGKTYYDFYSLIPDYLGVYAIFNQAVKRWLIPTSLRKLSETRVDWDTAYGTPWYFASINFRYVAIWRKPNSPNYGDMNIFYLKQAPILYDNTDIPILLDHFNDLEMYVETDLLEQNEEFSQATTLFKDYQSNLAEYKNVIGSKRNLGRIPNLR